MGANSNYLFYCLRIVTNDTYPVAPPLVGMETVLNIIPSMQILENRAPIPEKKYLENDSDTIWAKTVLINPSIVVQWDKLKKDWINSLRIGDIVDANHRTSYEGRWHGETCYHDNWYESVIRWIEVKDNKKLLYLHYIGRNKECDEAIMQMIWSGLQSGIQRQTDLIARDQSIGIRSVILITG